MRRMPRSDLERGWVVKHCWQPLRLSERWEKPFPFFFFYFYFFFFFLICPIGHSLFCTGLLFFIHTHPSHQAASDEQSTTRHALCSSPPLAATAAAHGIHQRPVRRRWWSSSGPDLRTSVIPPPPARTFALLHNHPVRPAVSNVLASTSELTAADPVAGIRRFNILGPRVGFFSPSGERHPRRQRQPQWPAHRDRAPEAQTAAGLPGMRLVSQKEDKM